ncbi:cytochrome c oxidase subunit II [Halomonas sp. DX6]|uniref:Cytochrome aa3 subunit 2 n=2 Tax=Billgrantia bachuensis TaxID=2717286 RepID=A0ABX0PNC5_9GAMM|nr:cytochrome c oxidase subunit II [Halomonas bachuensis]NIC04650.1 cytochrome c oxidase subunit II [Halomonas bachuensis]
MSTMDAAGPAAQDQFWVWWAMLTVSLIVAAVVFVLWLFTFRRREQPQRTAREERRIMLRWVLGGGVALPVASIIALLVFAAPTGRGMLPLPLAEGEAERIEVVGHQWWWEVRYPGANGERDVVTANRLVMPAGEPVDFRLTSADVIHAFWIPRLGGKRDMVPGRHSTVRLEAESSGVFGAQCAEYCGAQHTHMLLHVEALERDEFEAWLAERRSPHQLRDGFDEAQEAFGEHCAACHTVDGFPEELIVDDMSHDIEGPDLSDIGSRPTLGAGVLPMEEGAIAYWLQHHQTLKPGNRMPPHNHIDTETLEDIGAWLETLEP